MVPRTELRPGYSISRLIVGGWQLSTGHHPGGVDRDGAVRSLERMVDAGLTAFDGADIYGGVESLFGELLRRRRRTRGGVSADEIRIHTKLVPDLSALPDLRRQDVEAIVDRSLSRLGVEALDLVQFHWWDWQIPGWLEALDWLRDLSQQGKIRHLGVTNFDAPHLREALDAGLDIVANQVQYSLLDRRPAGEMTRLCAERDVHLLCYGTLAGGFLSKRWQHQPDPGLDGGNRSLTKYRLVIDEPRSPSPGDPELGDPGPGDPGLGDVDLDGASWQKFLGLLETLASLADGRGASIANLATRWVLDRPRVAAAIVGVRDGRHLDDNLALFRIAADEDFRREMEGVLCAWPGPRGPVFGLERRPGGRHALIMKTELNRSES